MKEQTIKIGNVELIVFGETFIDLKTTFAFRDNRCKKGFRLINGKDLTKKQWTALMNMGGAKYSNLAKHFLGVVK